MPYHFVYDKRLGIQIPVLEKTWEEYHQETQEQIISDWEKIRGKIPDRIKQLEGEIAEKQNQLSQEENFEKSCRLNSKIADLASTINDLWIWYRTPLKIS
ncbi:gas vesicle protein [Scopulibacillus daqui]|uniref:Gas vesicle protein n=1 Tax=Scopulibacillus daqui TaxID=1469162 RepID=A0ABS2PXY7_9BACL|nr:hypothetical protein [Scopulibacillus daqui]MBM7644813.1 gas vesicle protein [Scopulibacillus daqui]